MLENSRITQTDQEIAGSARFFRSLLAGSKTNFTGNPTNRDLEKCTIWDLCYTPRT